MPSARTHCPKCTHSGVIGLDDILSSASHDYFRCKHCGAWWIVPKGQDDPPTLIGMSPPDKDR